MVAVAEALTLGALLALAVAVFLSVPAEAVLVALEMWTRPTAPGARVPSCRSGPGSRTAPVMVHVPGPV